MSTRYTCVGDVRGRCRIMHRSIAAAVRCLANDQRACRRGGGAGAYSDRHIRAVEPDGTVRRLTGDEYDKAIDEDIRLHGGA